MLPSMDKLLYFLNALPPEKRTVFSNKCGTTEGYIRKACSSKQRLRADLCIAIERESGGAVRCEDLRQDVDWAFIRRSDKKVA